MAEVDSIFEHETVRQGLVDAILILSGATMGAFALKSFILANHFIDGGITGLSVTVSLFSGIDVAWLYLPMSVPFCLWGVRLVSRGFGWRTFGGIMMFTLGMLLPFPELVTDRLLAAVFGGTAMGTGIALAMRGGAALDGADIAVLYSGRRLPFTSNEIIMALNAVLFAVAAAKLGTEIAMYSMITHWCGNKTSGFLVGGLQQYIGVTVVSRDSEAVKRVLVEDLGRGITVYKGRAGFLPGSFHISREADIVFAVVTRIEMRRLAQAVRALDPAAFVVASAVNDAAGGVLTRRRMVD